MMQTTCPCIECENFTKSKFKCSVTCKPLEEFNDYLSYSKVPNTDLKYDLFTESTVTVRTGKSRYFF